MFSALKFKFSCYNELLSLKKELSSEHKSHYFCALDTLHLVLVGLLKEMSSGFDGNGESSGLVSGLL